MATYTKQTWENEPSTATPLSAARMNHIEDGIEGAYLDFVPENPANKGVPNGYASLNANGEVPANQLPSYVDDVLEYDSFGLFPGTAEKGKIYVAIDTNKQYRWGGSSYIEISSSPGSSDEVPEGISNLYFTNARAQAAVSSQLSAKANSSVKVQAGTGLSGGGDLTADRTFSVSFGTSVGTVCQGNDSRLSDARTPVSHTHSASDITSGQLNIAQIPTGTTASTVCVGNDSRLSNARTPTAHTHAATDINSGTLAVARIPTGTTSATVCIGNDSRLSDARTPTAHNHSASDITSGTLAIARGGTGGATSAAARTALGVPATADLTAIENLLPTKVTQAQYNALGSGRPARIYAIVG